MMPTQWMLGYLWNTTVLEYPSIPVKAIIDDVLDVLSVKESLQKVILRYNWYPTGLDD